jgi:hypothetical protein
MFYIANETLLEDHIDDCKVFIPEINTEEIAKFTKNKISDKE